MSETKLTFTGGCYCGDVRYQCEGPPLMKGQCYCLTCQMISGGAGNLFMAVAAHRFEVFHGHPTTFNKRGAPGAPTRHFFPDVGAPPPPRSDCAASAEPLHVSVPDDPPSRH